jgi:predicted TIM-barrel fold metal-dependent hydrolase
MPAHQDAAVEDILEPDLEICDPHHHLMDHAGWRYLPEDYLRDMTDGHRVTSTIYVEGSAHYRTSGPEHLREVGEIEYVRQVQQQTREAASWIGRGIVGHVDLASGPLVGEALDAQIAASGGTLKGIRHDSSWDDSGTLHIRYQNSGPDLYARSAFKAGVGELTRRGLTLDTWQYFYQLPVLASLARDCPDARIMIDHCGGVVGIGPYKRDETFEIWRGHIRDLAQFPNLWIKLGGLGMEIAGFDFPHRATPASSEEIAAAWKPYVETCIESFGPQRCMFESNFPIDQPSCSYRTMWNAFKRIAVQASPAEKAMLFRDNAVCFYRLDEPPAV